MVAAGVLRTFLTRMRIINKIILKFIKSNMLIIIFLAFRFRLNGFAKKKKRVIIGPDVQYSFWVNKLSQINWHQFLCNVIDV